MLHIAELLSLRGLDVNDKVKIIRHQDPKYDMKEIIRCNQFDIYQSYQSKDVFNCGYIVSCIGYGGTQAVFYGVYKVLGKQDGRYVPRPSGLIYPDMVGQSPRFFYNLKEMPAYADLRHRVVIEWGRNTRMWHQWLTATKPKPVLEVLAPGREKAFPGYMNLVLTHQQLTHVISNPKQHSDWHKSLSAVAGIYLILDRKTGKQYVGSAYGHKGILGRWASYATHAHGGNKQLRVLIEKDPAYSRYLRFSILQTLSKQLTKNEVIEYERIYKDKLGSRTIGLNSN